jgi:death-on-curing protein
VRFPTRDNIIQLNRRHITRSGDDWIGTENLENSGSLEWVLDAIQYPLFGIDLYPTLADKAAILAWTIIDGHVFYDGCKRTGVSALEIFVRLNGYALEATSEELIDVALRIADRSDERPYSIPEFVNWVRTRLNLTTSSGSAPREGNGAAS